MTHYRHVAIALAVLAGSAAAGAQTTVITREPIETQTVVTAPPVQLTPVQRHTIYREIVHERVVPAPGTVEYRVGAQIPPGSRLYTVPQSVAVEVPAVKEYRYMLVNDRVVLVDPVTSEVVAELSD